MGSLKGPEVITLDNQLGVVSTVNDAVKGLIIAGVGLPEWALGTVKRITRLKDVEILGINASYDNNNQVHVHAVIREIYRLQPETVLYVMLIARNIFQATIVNTQWPQLVKSTQRGERISTTAIKTNRPSTFVPVVENNVWADISITIPLWQAANDALESEGYYPGCLILDGAYFATDPAVTTLDLRAIGGAPGVMVCIGQDAALAGAGWNAGSSAVGTLLGLVAMRKLSESIAAPFVEKPPKKWFGKPVVSLTDAAANRWIVPQLSNNIPVANLSSEVIQELINKGYTFMAAYGNYPGVYGAGGGTAVEAVSDLAFHDRYEVIQKAKHLAYQFFIPYKNRNVDLEGGKLSEEFVKFAENEATKAVIGVLRREGNISDPEKVEGSGVFLPNDYNFVTGEHDSGNPDLNVAPETLVVNIGVPIKGKLRNITIYVGLKA